MTFKLCDNVIPTYNEICSSQQGQITLTKLVLEEIFYISCNIINVLKNFLKIFESGGSTCIQGRHLAWWNLWRCPFWFYQVQKQRLQRSFPTSNNSGDDWSLLLHSLIVASSCGSSSSESNVPKVKHFSVMTMNLRKSLKPPTNGLYFAMLVLVSTVAEIMVSITVKNPVAKLALCRTRLSTKWKRIVVQVIIATMSGILAVAKILKAVGIINK